MTELAQVVALLKAIDSRLARIERLMEPWRIEPSIFIGDPATIGQPTLPGARVIPFKGPVT